MGKKRKKLRVDFRKNRQKRSRDNKLTRQVNQDGVEDVEYRHDERLTGKGDLTRRRTIIGVEDESGDIVLEIDESKCERGRVLYASGLHTLVEGPDRERYECSVRRVVRTMARDARNAVVAGDHVLFQPTDRSGHDLPQGVIERVEPRHGVLSRRSYRREHMIVTNVDQCLIVVSAVDPPIKPSLVDRFLISSEKGRVHSIICVNKCDLVDPVLLQPLLGIYSRLGYDVVLASATTGMGIDRLRTLCRNRETAFSGQSGVGKTTILNALQPGLKLRTAEVSDGSRKGQHTTRRAELLPLSFGGWVVDTPGIRQFGLWDVEAGEVEAYFVEFGPFVAHCRFPDCTHTHESECAVKQAVERRLVSRMRYESYLKILTDEDD